MKFKTAAAASVAALLFVAGCGTDADETDTDMDTTMDPVTTEPVETEPMESEDPMESEEPMESEDPMESDEPMDSEDPMEGSGTIVDVAAGNDDFETLVAAVNAADLTETLSSEGPFTVFAPTDDAFDALPEGLLDALLMPENQDALTSILTYHVLPAEVMSADVTAGEVETVEGSTVEIMTEGGVMVNDATVIMADVDASNGVIHAIDAVLVPPTVDVDALLG